MTTITIDGQEYKRSDIEFTAKEEKITTDQVIARLKGNNNEVPRETESRTFMQGLGVTNENNEFDSLSGVGSRIADASYNIKGGEVLFEQAVKYTNNDLYQANRDAEIYEKWQPQIWNAQDRLDLIQDDKSQEYQQAFEDIQTLRQNMNLDLKGLYSPEDESTDWGEVLETLSNNKAYTAGQIIRQFIADPALMLIPAGYQKAALSTYKTVKALKAAETVAKTSKIVGGAAGSGAVGYGLGGVMGSIDQADENPDVPIDFNRVNDEALKLAAFSAAVPIVGVTAKNTITGTAGAVKKSLDKGLVRRIEKEAQDIFTRNIKDGKPTVSRRSAVLRAYAKHNPTKTVEVSPVQEFMNLDALKIAQGKANAKPTIKEKTIQAFVTGRNSIVDNWNATIQPVVSRLRDIGQVELATKLESHDMNFMTDLQSKLAIKDRFSKTFHNLTDQQKDLVHFHLNNGTLDNFVANNKLPVEFIESTKEVKGLLSSFIDDFGDVGFDVKSRSNYFPREINYSRFAKDHNIDTTQARQVLADAINRKLKLRPEDQLSGKTLTDRQIQQHLSNNEIAQAISRNIITDKNKSTRLTTSNIKERVIEEIAPEDLHYYEDPVKALTNYIVRNTTKIHDRRFFGGKSVKNATSEIDADAIDESMYKEIIADFIEKGKKNKSILPEEADEIMSILQSRFISGMKSPSKGIAGMKNLMYAMTLGNPISAATQFGDLGAAAYLNKVNDAVVETANKLWRSSKKGVGAKDVDKGKFTMEDFGLDALTHEFEHLGTTSKILDWSLQKGGFKWADRLGKEVILNSTFKTLKSKASSKNADKYFDQRFGGKLSPDEITKMKEGFKKGDMKDPSVRLALFSELSRVQPVTMSQMPKVYLDHPNGRIFYMLKTFTLKQLDLARNDILKEGAKGNVGRAAYNLGKMAATIGLANAGVEQTKNWLQGKDNISLTEAAFVNLLRNWGVSQYTLSDIEQGKPIDAAINMVTPPYKTIQNPIQWAFGEGDGLKAMQSIPVFGKPMSWWLTGEDSEFEVKDEKFEDE